MKKILILSTLIFLLILQGCAPANNSTVKESATSSEKPIVTEKPTEKISKTEVPDINKNNETTPKTQLEEPKSYDQVIGLKPADISKLEIALKNGSGWHPITLNRIYIEEVLLHLRNQTYLPYQKSKGTNNQLASDTSSYRLIVSTNDSAFYINFNHNNSKLVKIKDNYYLLKDEILFSYIKQVYDKLS